MSVNLDRLFGSLNHANTIINGDFSGFELTFYTDVPSNISTGALNESHFCDQSRGMRFRIQEWPEKARVVLYEYSTPLAEVEYNSDNPMFEMLLRKLCYPSNEMPLPDDEALKSQILQGIYVN
ncbi:MAG: hypothetical protein HC851_21775 [Acaryochloris sp. RU_4_1]|nr:hypothetical protein [Acaryochloris sp. RU_4_1]NJR56626.1 hypothetical protein [Acaryochloris sp. CRU_2_0]